MKRFFRGVGIDVAMILVMGMFTALSAGCGTIDAGGFLGLETCDILNCDGMFFRNVADDHDDMAGMDEMVDAEAHDDEGGDHMDDMDDNDDELDNDHMDDMGRHDEVEEEEYDDATEGDDGSGSGVARSQSTSSVVNAAATDPGPSPQAPSDAPRFQNPEVTRLEQNILYAVR